MILYYLSPLPTIFMEIRFTRCIKIFFHPLYFYLVHSERSSPRYDFTPFSPRTKVRWTHIGVKLEELHLRSRRCIRRRRNDDIITLSRAWFISTESMGPAVSEVRQMGFSLAIYHPIKYRGIKTDPSPFIFRPSLHNTVCVYTVQAGDELSRGLMYVCVCVCVYSAMHTVGVCCVNADICLSFGLWEFTEEAAEKLVLFANLQRKTDTLKTPSKPQH